MAKYLIVVDMQKDFVSGSLGSDEARQILPLVIDKVKRFDGEIIFTKDTHTKDYLNTQEGKNLPVMHCVKNTDGWEIADGLCEVGAVYEKETFGSVSLAQDLKKKYDKGEVDSVELVGLCTDICVVSNALLLKAFMPELPIYVDEKCCAGVTPQSHEAAMITMTSCQILRS